MRTLKWFSIVSVLTLSLFVIFILTLDVNQYKDNIEKTVSRVLDRQVELRGDISMGIALIPTVVANDIHISNVEWLDGNDFAVINKLAFEIELLALVFDKQVRINTIELNGANVILAKDRDGNNNWTLGGQRTGTQSSDLPEIHKVSIENSTISYRGPDKQIEKVYIEKAEVALEGDAEFSLELQGKFREESFLARLEGEQPELLAGVPSSLMFALQLEYRGFTLASNASISNDESFAVQLDKLKLESSTEEIPISISEGKLSWGGDSDLQLSIAGQYSDTPIKLNATAGSIKALLSNEAWPVKSTLVFDKRSLDSTVTLSGELIKPVLEIQHAMYGESEFIGKLTLDRQQKPMAISGNLKSSRLNIDDFIISLPEKSERQDSLIRLPKNINLDLQLAIKKLKNTPWDVTSIQGKTRLHNGVLQLTKLEFTVPSGDIAGSATIDTSKESSEYSLDLTSSKLNISKLLRGHKISGYTVAGALGVVNLSMQGQMATLNEPQESRMQLKVGKSQLSIQSGKNTDMEPLLLNKFQLLSVPKKSVSIDMNGQRRGAPFTFNLVTADLVTLQQSSKPLPIELTASFADHQLLAKGTVGDRQTGEGLNIDLELKGQELHTLGPLYNINLIKMGSYAMKGRLTGKVGRYSVKNITGKINQSDVNGNLEVLTNQSRPMIVANLFADELRYHDIFPATKKKKSKKLIPAYKIPAGFLKVFNAKIDIKAKKFFIGEVEYENLILHADLKDGVLKVDPFDAELGGTKIHNDLEVVVSSEIPTTQWRLSALDSDYGSLLESLGLTDKVEGLADVEVHLQGHGKTLRDNLANADGRVQIIAGKGKIKEPRFDLWAADLVTSMLSSSWEEKEDTSVQCIIGQFEIKDGLATSDTLILDTTEITVAGTASLNFKSESIDAVIQPAPKKPSLVSLAHPVKLSGNLYAPKVTVEKTLGRKWSLGGVLLGLANPAALLLMYSDLGSGVENHCYSAAQKRDAKEAEAEKEGTLDVLKLPGKLFRRVF